MALVRILVDGYSLLYDLYYPKLRFSGDRQHFRGFPNVFENQNPYTTKDPQNQSTAPTSYPSIGKKTLGGPHYSGSRSSTR